MKPYLLFAAACLFPAGWAIAQTQTSAPFVYETPAEFFGMGDFDGDGRLDAVIADKETGKFRLGYQTSTGLLAWVDCRITGIKGVTGFSIGKFFSNSFDGLAFTSPDANQIVLANASSPSAPSRPINVMFDAAIGPNTLVAVDVGGAGNTSLADLLVGSVYNSPDPNLITLLRNNGAEFPKIVESPSPAPVTRGNPLLLKPGQPPAACALISDDKGATFRAFNISSGKTDDAASVSGLPAGTDYAVGNFRKLALPELLFYTPGENSLSVSLGEEASPGRFQFSKPAVFDLGTGIRSVVTLNEKGGQKLFVIFGEGEKAGVFTFDGVTAPKLAQTIIATNELLTGVAGLPDGFVTFSHTSTTKFSTRYQRYLASGPSYTFNVFGGLPTLADNDNVTIPEIHDRIVAQLKVQNEAEMQTYTNAIPGTQVNYVMVPIRGGEFLMGSPDSEAERKPDESPQHKVKISPFWMGQCEVSWNEYELFMYPDEERRTRLSTPTDEEGDKLADAVTHPSKPYVEMSFGMGKDNYPAISMTQHGANKYCQWLSAKTGHFYRLPTEAEWEYACRAGTTTAYFFGDDAAELGQYAWFEQNSDFKYQKIRRKKPNPWGLYDIYGNVVEWVLDQYSPDFYSECASKNPTIDPWNRATKPYPHAVRGGSWDDTPAMCRSATRRGSDRAWKMQDPQLPKSVWYHSDAQWVGFRMVRPLKVPPPEQLQKYWTSGVEKD